MKKITIEIHCNGYVDGLLVNGSLRFNIRRFGFGEEQEMLPPSLIHGNANPHTHQAHCRPVDRCRGG